MDIQRAKQVTVGLSTFVQSSPGGYNEMVDFWNFRVYPIKFE